MSKRKIKPFECKKQKPKVMRTIKELLKVMLDNKNYFEIGLCRWVHSLWEDNVITTHERFLLGAYVKSNKPFIFSSVDAFIQRLNKTNFFWEPGNITPRIEWLKTHINKC